MREASHGFWRDAFAIHGSVTPIVLPTVLMFGGISLGIVLFSRLLEHFWDIRIAVEVAPYEIAGAALGLLLILRTNAGYDRWWEARKLWGGIVNQSRNLVISGFAYGPADQHWRERWAKWVATFPHVARCGLRGESPGKEVEHLVGAEEARRIESSNHRPSFVALKLASILREARDHHELDGFDFLQIDKERAQLIDHLGACERILKTPLPLVYSIKIRRFISIFLMTVPVALLHRMGTEWVIPLITMLVAYPLLSLDQIGVELQNPFAKKNLSHLPIGDISATIENNVIALLAEAPFGHEATRSTIGRRASERTEHRDGRDHHAVSPHVKARRDSVG